MDRYGLERGIKSSVANNKSIAEFKKAENYVVTEQGSSGATALGDFTD